MTSDSSLTSSTAADERELHPIALAATLGAVMVPIMSFFTVNVALGRIGHDLGASAGWLQLVVAAYGVVYASLVTVGGRLGDGLGRKRLLMIGLMSFAVTSVLCSVAQRPEQLVGARFLQGVSAALLTPQVLGTITAGTTGAHRARAMAWFGASGGLATSLAFLVGGALTESAFGWRAVFWVFAPVALLLTVVVLRFVPETKAAGRAPMDLPGAALLAATLTLLVLPLTEGRAVGWPAWTWACIVAVLPAAGLFVGWQRTLEARGGLPLVPPSLLQVRSIGVGLVVSLPFFVAFGGFMFVYAYAGQADGLGSLAIGLRLLPLALVVLFGSLVAGRLVTRYGPAVLTSGALVAAVGFSLFARSDVDHVLVPMVVAGIGIGLVWSPMMGVVLSQVPGHLAGVASGVLMTAMQAGLGLGSAVIGAFYLGQPDPTGDAFTRTALLLSGVMLAMAALTRLLVPGARRSPADE